MPARECSPRWAGHMNLKSTRLPPSLKWFKTKLSMSFSLRAVFNGSETIGQSYDSSRLGGAKLIKTSYFLHKHSLFWNQQLGFWTWRKSIKKCLCGTTITRRSSGCMTSWKQLSVFYQQKNGCISLKYPNR